MFDDSDYKVEQNIYGDIVETDKHGNTRKFRVEKRADGSTRVYEDPTVSVRMVRSPFEGQVHEPVSSRQGFIFSSGSFFFFGILTAIGFALNWWSWVMLLLIACASVCLALAISDYLMWKSKTISFAAAQLWCLLYPAVTGILTIVGIVRHWHPFILLVMIQLVAIGSFFVQFTASDKVEAKPADRKQQLFWISLPLVFFLAGAFCTRADIEVSTDFMLGAVVYFVFGFFSFASSKNGKKDNSLQ